MCFYTVYKKIKILYIKMTIGKEHLSNEEIRETVKKIREFKGTVKEREQNAIKNYKKFSDMYTHLMLVACEEKFENDKLEYFLKMRESIMKGKMSAHDASVEVGKKILNPLLEEHEKNKNKN